MVLTALMVLAIVPAFCIMQITVEPDGKPITADNAAAVKDVIAATTELRLLVEQYYAEHGLYPTSNEQAGLKSPGSYSSGALKRATVGRHGQIELVMTKRSGRYDGNLTMVPQFRNEREGIVWLYQTTNLKGLDKHLPGCRYLKGR
ncbi:MAG: hypothetical protein BWY87_01197 [Deltaproteobacteria bacterium ADurb.Bin510]|nr:MAG: hypothetical protein BWY87_01197 [Deltaproteobacteria bacterium ADurb.Bin510]